MDKSVDALDRTHWTQDVDRVHGSPESARPNDRRFAQALKNEKEGRQRKQKPAEDELLLSDDAEATETELSSDDEPQDQTARAGDTSDDETPETPPTHVDVTA